MKTIFVIPLLICVLNLYAQDDLDDSNLEKLDSICKQESNPKQKLACVLSMLEIGKQKFGVEDTSYAEILKTVGNAYLDVNLDSSIAFTKRAIAIQKVKIPQHAEYAKSLNNLGIAYYYLGQLDQTEKYWSEALAIRKIVLGKKHKSYMGTVVNLGNLYMGLGQYPKAINNFTYAKSLFEEANLTKHPFYINCLNNLGIVYETISDYEKAESYYLQTISVQKEIHGEKHPTYLVSMGYLASLYKAMGNYEKAESFLLRVLKLKKEVFGEEHFRYTETVNSLGNLYLDMKDYKKAEKFYTEDLTITKKVHGENYRGYAESLGNMGILYRRMGDHAKAESTLIQALKIKKKIHGEKHPTYARALNNLGNLYADMRNYDQTEVLYLESYNIRKEVLGDKNEDVILSINNLAAVYSDKNQFDLTWEYLLLAIKANTDLTMSKNISQEWIDSLEKAEYVSLDEINTSLYIITEILEKQNHAHSKKQEVLICDLALKLLQRKKNRLDAEEDRLRILNKSAGWVIHSMEAFDKEKDVAKAFNVVEQNKSVLLLDAVSNKRAYNLGVLPDSIVEQEKELQKQYAATQAALVEKRSDKQRDSLRNVFMALNFKIDEFEKNIKTNYPKYAAMKYQHEAIQVDKIQALLEDNTAMLEYLIGDSVVYIFYVDKNQVNLHEFAVSNVLLKNKIHALHDALSNYSLIKNKNLAYRKYTVEADWFYRNLVAPALVSAKNIEELIIVPDGELGHLPFETFLVEQAPQDLTDYHELHYLISDYSISYNYSATLWEENKEHKKGHNNGQILGMAANYEMTLDSSKSNLRIPADIRMRSVLKPLPAARREVKALEEEFNGFFAFDSLASEKVFKEKSSSFAVIHLAMHGLLNKREQVLSNLVFTENSDSLENNFLHVYEISKMELNADLVILSACETGFGKFERGNGIASLARAFMYAGAPAMIVSLWQVNDYATAQIMKNLYNNLTDGMHKDDALRQAKILYIKRAKDILAHPAFWSPFILVGNETPITISKKGGLMPWAIGGGILVLLIGGFAMSRSKKEAA